VNSGYKVAICEQTENGKQMEARLAKEKKEGVAEGAGPTIKAVAREVAHIYTKGTHFKREVDPKLVLGDYDTKHVLSFY